MRQRARGRRSRSAPGCAAWRLTRARPALRRAVGAGGRRRRLGRADRFGGGGALRAAGRAGAAMRFALHDLPDGPGQRAAQARRATANRLLADPARARLVGRRSRIAIRCGCSTAAFARALETRRLDVDWPANQRRRSAGRGERRRGAGAARRRRAAVGRRASARSRRAWTSDATRLPDGRLVLLVRRPSLRGFRQRSADRGGRGQAGAANRARPRRRSTMSKGSRPRPCPMAERGCGSSATIISGRGCGPCSSRSTCAPGALKRG